MAMVKTYFRDEAGVLWYREIWRDGNIMVRHEGKAGTKGKSSTKSVRTRTWPSNPTATEQFAAFREQAIADGYAELSDEQMGTVVLQVWTATPDLSDPDDAWVLDAGEDALNEHLGWLGLGHCDGNDIGGLPPAASGREGTVINLFCPVVDTALGVKALRRFVSAHDLAPHCAIATREPDPDAEYVLAWAPRKSVAEQFSL